MKLRLAFTLAISIVAIGNAYAQQPSRKSAKPANATAQVPVPKEPEIPAPPPPPAPFAPVAWTAETPYSAYKANQAPLVFEWLSKQIASISGRPDQFSTSAEKKAYETALDAKVKSIGQLAMVIPCVKKFNADAQSYELKIGGSGIDDPLLSDPSPEKFLLRKVTLARGESKKDTYTGQNAYGASTEIIRTVGENYAIAFTMDANRDPVSAWEQAAVSFRPIPYKLNYGSYVLKFSMTPAEAREQDKKITCLSVFSVTMPGLFKFTERSSPTRDFPFDSTFTFQTVAGTLDMVAAFNLETGQTYARAVRTGSGL